MGITKMLSGHELFQSLRFEDVDRINRFSALKKLDAGHLVFRSGNMGTHIFMLQEGTIHLRLPARAHEASLLVGVFGRGDLFGLAPLLRSGPHLTSAECVTSCQVLAIEAEPLRRLLEEESQVGFRVMRMAARAYFTRYVEMLRRLQTVVNELAVS